MSFWRQWGRGWNSHHRYVLNSLGLPGTENSNSADANKHANPAAKRCRLRSKTRKSCSGVQTDCNKRVESLVILAGF